jgi:hypothetical protein
MLSAATTHPRQIRRGRGCAEAVLVPGLAPASLKAVLLRNAFDEMPR